MSHALPILPPEESMPLRILVVDDHPSFRRALASALGLVRDVEIVGEVDGGLAAVERAERSSADLVLMDLSMPDIDGIEAMRRIRATRPDLPVVILTAHADPGIEREAFAAGASGFLAKGVSLEELVGVLRQAAAARV
jgi:DNA-binding NarL/FixJ family response regulator